jgi:hypothetical protein
MIFVFMLLVCIAQVAAFTQSARAATTVLAGSVLANGKPVAAAAVSLTGNNLTHSTRTNDQGRFAFPDLPPGSYLVTATAVAGTAQLRVDLATVGADVTLDLGAKQLGIVTVTTSSAVRKAGTDVTLNRQALTKTPATGNFPELLVQLPGAARGANGVVHINGDHGDINYIVDGIAVPQELNRVVGTEFNPNDISFIDVLQGAYPAQYGGKFASILNISTRSVGAPGLSGSFEAGSFGTLDGALGYENSVGEGSLVVALREQATNRGSDPPNLDSPHNDGSNGNQFVRYTTPMGSNYVNVVLSHSLQTYQIPMNVQDGGPPSTDDNEYQGDTFGALQIRHPLNDHGVLSYGFGYKDSHIQDFGDPVNDWTYGEAVNVGLGGLPTDCANAFTIPNYNSLTCGYTLFSNRTAKDYIFNLDNAVTSDRHAVRYGALYDVTNVTKTYNITLQPGNFLAPLFAPGSPGAAYSVVDNAPNDVDAESAYLQDSWRMSDSYELDYGVRSDSFQIRSGSFDQGFAMFSPRVKLTRLFDSRAGVYGFYGRFFTPFSFENVSPYAAFILNLPLQPALQQFDLKPQRDSVYEIGGHLPVGAGDLGLRVMQKDATDLIDDTQVGLTQLHQDINYQLGRIATQSAYLHMPMGTGQSSYYVTANHTYSVNKGCETQLLAPCFGSPTDWTPADHEQRWGATAGVVLNNTRGGWFSMDGEYGSGLSSAGCPPGTPGYCKYTPHTIFSVEEGVALSSQTKVVARIVNLLNDHFYITYLNAQGNHWYTERAFSLALQFGPSTH